MEAMWKVGFVQLVAVAVLAFVARACFGDELSLSNDQFSKLSAVKLRTRGLSNEAKCSYYVATLRKIIETPGLSDSNLLREAIDSLEQKKSPTWSPVIQDLKGCSQGTSSNRMDQTNRSPGEDNAQHDRSNGDDLKQIEALKRELDQLRRQADARAAGGDSKQAGEIEALRKELDQVKREAVEKSVCEGAKDIEVETLKKELDQLRRQAVEKSINENYERIEIETLKKELDLVRRQAVEKSVSEASKQIEIETLKEELNQLASSKAMLHCSQSELEVSRRSLASKFEATLAAKEDQISALQAQLVSLKSEIDGAKSAADDKCARESTYQAKISTAKESLSNCLEREDSLKRQADNLRAELQRVRKTVTELQAAKSMKMAELEANSDSNRVVTEETALELFKEVKDSDRSQRCLKYFLIYGQTVRPSKQAKFTRGDARAIAEIDTSGLELSFSPVRKEDGRWLQRKAIEILRENSRTLSQFANDILACVPLPQQQYHRPRFVYL